MAAKQTGYKKFYLLVSLFLYVTAALSGNSNPTSTTQTADPEKLARRIINNCLNTTPPAGWVYYEKGGAFGLFQIKEHSAKIDAGADDSYQFTIVSSSENNKKTDKRDPRSPVKSGDAGPFSLTERFAHLNPFHSDHKDLVIETATDQSLNVSYRRLDPETNSWVRMQGELQLDMETGTISSMRIDQIDIKKKEKEVFWDVYFSKTSPETSRIENIVHTNIGTFLIFEYHFSSTLTYRYH